MRVTEKLTKQLTEAKYLNAENADRYRCIMRIFYENHEKLKYWMYQEEVYELMIQDEYFKDYKAEQCQQDMSALVEWKNLTATQDTRRVASLEEFKNRKFRYQMSKYSVEIERLVLRLENLLVEGASLEPSLLERIKINLLKLSEVLKTPGEQIYSWWMDLNNDFVRLNQNYQDYIRDLNSVKAEEMMKTREFLVFKDKLIEYLRSFIKGLQRNTGIIEEILGQIPKEEEQKLLEEVTEHEKSIPRIDGEVSFESLMEKNQGRWKSITEWFMGKNGQENEAGKLFDATNEIIRKITRYAAQLSEKNAAGASRKDEYFKAAQLFMKCEDLSQAHRMSAMIFGLEKPAHLKGELIRETDSMNSGVYEEKPMDLLIKPRIRTYRERSGRTGMNDHSAEKENVKRQMLEEIQRNKEKINALTTEGRIVFSRLPVIEPGIREILLRWLSDAMEDPELSGKTEDGREFFLEIKEAKKSCVVRCEDGNFTMPEMELVWKEETI